MEVETSRRLPGLAIAEILFDVRQTGFTKELRIIRHRGRQSKKTVNANIDPIMETRHLV
jgi:hypothetical protein